MPHEQIYMCIQVLLPTTGKSLLCRRSRFPTRNRSPRFPPLAIAPRTFHSNILPHPPVRLLSVCCVLPYSSTIAIPFLLSFLVLLSCIRQTYLWTVSLLSLLLNPGILSLPRHAILRQLPNWLFSAIQLYQLLLATSNPAYST